MVFRFYALVAAFALVACSDPADFRPARNARDFSSVKDAYRVPEAPSDCLPIGTVHAQSEESPLDDIAKTAARHGGTHYVIRGDQTVTGYTGTSTPALLGTSYEVEPKDLRRTWAEVYRCPS